MQPDNTQTFSAFELCIAFQSVRESGSTVSPSSLDAIVRGFPGLYPLIELTQAAGDRLQDVGYQDVLASVTAEEYRGVAIVSDSTLSLGKNAKGRKYTPSAEIGERLARFGYKLEHQSVISGGEAMDLSKAA